VTLAATLICRAGSTCHYGGGVPTWIAIAGPIVAAVGATIAFFAVVRSQRSNAISAISHCAQRYHEIMSDVKEVEAGNTTPGSWWYRYWDLHTEQFMLFRKGLLDRDIYELWINELATTYQWEPAPNGQRRAAAHATYLAQALPHFGKLREFYRRLASISRIPDADTRGEQVEALMDLYDPRSARRLRRAVNGRLRLRREASDNTGPDDPYAIVVGQATIAQRVSEMAEQLNADYSDREILLICVLKGAFVFASDLLRQITRPVDVEFIMASSYGSGQESSTITIRDRIDTDLKDRHVLIVEDIVETGKTLKRIQDEVSSRGAASIASCALLMKPGRLAVDIRVDYVGFDSVPQMFVVGYGIDFANRYRNLPEVSAVDRHGTLLTPATAVLAEDSEP
jgi:hypoxanthine phosphoribosyltransferase